jgi:hypothetical protein
MARGVLLGWAVALGCAQVFDLEEGKLAPDAGNPPRSPCERYCDATTSACTLENTVYQGGYAECLSVCPLLFEPAELECRAGQAELARGQGDKVEACGSAGPGGSFGEGSCEASLCDAYCKLMARQCPRTTLGAMPNDGAPTAGSDPDFCMRVCDDLPDVGTDADVYLSGTSMDGPEGPFVQCRLFHIVKAAKDGAPVEADSLHCSHAAGRLRFCRPEDDPALNQKN